MAKFITQLRHGSTEDWVASSVIPAKNELIVEYCEDGSRRFKLGNGYSKFIDLDYIDSDIERLVRSIDQRVSSLIVPPAGSISSDQEVADIRNSFDGTTVYDKAGDAVRAIGEETYNLKRSLQQFMHADAVDGLLYENNMLSLTADGVPVGDAVEIKGGAGGGEGYTIRIINNMIATSFTAATSAPTVLSATFEELYGRESTSTLGTLTVEYKLSEESKTSWKKLGNDLIIPQNIPFEVDVTSILTQDKTTNIKFTITGGESGQTKSLTYNITLVEAKISSVNFDTSAVFSGNVSFSYKCLGRDLAKNVHFVLDGVDKTVDIGTSHNKVETYVIETVGKLNYGAHDFKVYFTTPEGAVSNELRYTLLYNDRSSSAPMVGVISYSDKITYGDVLSLDYVVSTPNKETTDELIITVYSYDELGQKIQHSENTLKNIENNKLYNWQGSRYPESGAVYIEFKSSSTIKTVTVTVEEIKSEFDLNPVSSGLVYQYNASGRSNKDVDRELYIHEYTTADKVTTDIEATFENFNWVSNGYLDNTSLTISGEAKHTIKLPMFSTSYTDSKGQNIKLDVAEGATITTNGRTFEIEFSVSNVTDIQAKIIKCMSSDHAGFIVTPQNCYLLASNGEDVDLDETGFIQNESNVAAAYIKDNSRIRLAFVIEPKGSVKYMVDGLEFTGQCINLYINGEFASSFPYADNARFAQSEYITIGDDSCITNVYDVKIYNRGLTSDEILQNYKASPISAQDRIARFVDNDVLTDDVVDYEKAIKKYPCLLITGPLAAYKGAPGIREEDKTESGVTLTKPDGAGGYVTEFDLMDKDADGIWLSMNNVQGTSSVKFPVKNYKVYLRYAKLMEDGAIESKKLKYSLKGKDASGNDLSIGESTLCWKGDYMSSDHANTFNANLADTLFGDVLDSQDPSRGGDSRVQNTIYGFRCLLFRRDEVGGPIYFEGDGALNNDKGNTKTFGLECDGDRGNDTLRQKWEFKNNTEALTKFESDRFMELVNGDKRVLAGLESCYPDQGDLEDEGLEPRYEQLQMLYTWVCQRANFWDASSEVLDTPKTYKGLEYSTERDYRKAIFLAEFETHFNMNHALVYYLFNEFVALVDNRAKNMFLRSEDIRCEHIVKTGGETVSSIYEDSDIFDASTGAINADAIDWENSTFAQWITDLYDLDSCFGVENSGYLQIPYYAEWSYELKGSKKFNGYESRLWLMFEEAFASKIQQKAQELTSKQAGMGLNYETLYQYHIRDNALLVCPSIVNKDMEHKYSAPWTVGFIDYSQDSHPFVHMSDYKYLQRGSRTAQKDSFINRRCNMLYSKYLCDKFLNNNINFRAGVNVPATESGITITANQAIYPAIKFGDGDAAIVSAHKIMGGDDNSVTIRKMGSDAESVGKSDTVYIAGGTLLTDIGDISKFHPYELRLEKATGLKKLTVGSTDEGYNNTELRGIDTSGCRILEEINIANCSGLTGTIDLSKNGLLRKVVATGSGASSVTLPHGGVLEEIYLGPVIDLSILNQSNLNTFECSGYENLTTLRIENTTSIHTIPILTQTLSKLKGIRLVGIDEEVDMETLELLVRRCDVPQRDEYGEILTVDGKPVMLPSLQGKYMDNNGVVYEGANYPEYAERYPEITGTLKYDGEMDGALYAELKRIYPNLYVTYSKLVSTLTFKDYDGTTLATQEIVSFNNELSDGYCPVNAGEITTPTRNMDEKFTYTWNGGWTTDIENPTVKQDDALEDVAGYRVVYPTFDTSDRYYTVKFINNDGTLLQKVEVVYGHDANYDGESPKHSYAPELNAFAGWYPSPEKIVKDTECWAQYIFISSEIHTIGLNDISVELLAENKLKISNYNGGYSAVVIPGSFNIDGTEYTTTVVGGFNNTSGKILHMVEFPDSVEEFSDNAFDGCTELDEITIGENVEFIGARAFADCTDIKKINYNASEAKVYDASNVLNNSGASTTVGKEVFRNTGTAQHDVEIHIGNRVKYIPACLFQEFSGSNGNVKTVLLWEDDCQCKDVYKEAFSGANISGELSIPSSVCNIGYRAFNGSLIQNLTIPSTVESLYTEAFSNCSNLENVVIQKELHKTTSYNGNVFRDSNNIREIELNNNSTYIPTNFASGLEGLEDINIPENLETIDSSAFLGCINLFKNNPVLVIPDSVIYIASYAFNRCEKIESLQLPSSLSNLGNGHNFQDCTSISEVTFNSDYYFTDVLIKHLNGEISSSLNQGESAFLGCENIKKVYIKTSSEQTEEYKNLISRCLEHLSITVEPEYIKV